MSQEKKFSELYERYAGLIRKVAQRKLRHEADVEDVVQDVLIKLLRPEVQDAIANSTRPDAYVARMAINQVNQLWRDQHGEKCLSDLEEPGPDGVPEIQLAGPEATPEEILVRREEGERAHDLVWGAVNRLPSPFRQAVTLVDLEERSYKDAADALHVQNMNTMKSYVRRGRELLRNRLKADWDRHHRDAEPGGDPG